MNTQEFVTAHKVTMTAAKVEENKNMPEWHDADHWQVTLKMDGRKMTTFFSLGRGHNGKKPKAAEVLSCLADDAAGHDNAKSFEEWAREYDYDTDSRKAYNTYMLIGRQKQALKRLIDEHYDNLLFETERE